MARLADWANLLSSEVPTPTNYSRFTSPKFTDDSVCVLSTADSKYCTDCKCSSNYPLRTNLFC